MAWKEQHSLKIVMAVRPNFPAQTGTISVLFVLGQGHKVAPSLTSLSKPERTGCLPQKQSTSMSWSLGSWAKPPSLPMRGDLAVSAALSTSVVKRWNLTYLRKSYWVSPQKPWNQRHPNWPWLQPTTLQVAINTLTLKPELRQDLLVWLTILHSELISASPVT